MKKIDKVEVVYYQTMDGYSVDTYLNIEVPDDFDELDDDSKARYLDTLIPSRSKTDIRKVFEAELESVNYEF
jgi:hypothetical protein